MAKLVQYQGDRKVIERMRGMIVGRNKVGKSWLGATGRKPVIDWDVDLRADSLEGKDGVYTISPMDPPGLGMQPEVYNETLAFIGKLEQSRVMGDIDDALRAMPCAEQKVGTVVLDSLQSMARAIGQYNMYTNPKALAREIVIGRQKILFPSGWDTWNAEMECMEQLISRFVSIPEIDFFVTFHEEEKDGKVELFPARHRHITRYFNEVWRLTRPNNVPQLQIVPTYDFTACTTLVGAPPIIENPNITNMVEQYGRH